MRRTAEPKLGEHFSENLLYCRDFIVDVVPSHCQFTGHPNVPLEVSGRRTSGPNTGSRRCQLTADTPVWLFALLYPRIPSPPWLVPILYAIDLCLYVKITVELMTSNCL
jgi:hypothetical protein